ncbi:alpha/beta hydrolase [Ectobacillus antri]|jgi:pimeloyl-ACP methyl ester carboxylesterase|uniref:Alpha/beta hydrolase n=1 Tax=Ectobacillus antri TaxID=2486280 RepID=A0ABT6H7M4_9BACI|nr:alpha/beta hydrolase [Ectobacillus antri]MDG4658277.1 alpha/beta hydrolase [Ectobacillus antri]MDG5755342.1 alpha/beta hydrolase [Ectobacillus antri]
MKTTHIPSHFTFSIHNITVHYELYNYNPDEEQPTYVLIHGFLSSTFSYRRLIPLLAQKGTVIALDLPPFGKSEKSTRFTYSYRNLANLVIQLIEHLELKKVILVGHSMGGQISLYVSHLREDLVDKTVLLCSSSYLTKANPSLIYSSYLPFFYLYVKNWLVRKGVLHNLLNVVHDAELIDEEMMEGYAAPFYDDRIFQALTRMIRDREGDLPSLDLKQIKTPSLLIWGEEDRVVPIDVGRRLHQDLENSRFISYKKTGHLLPEEKPFDVYENIIEFVGM